MVIYYEGLGSHYLVGEVATLVFILLTYASQWSLQLALVVTTSVTTRVTTVADYSDGLYN